MDEQQLRVLARGLLDSSACADTPVAIVCTWSEPGTCRPLNAVVLEAVRLEDPIELSEDVRGGGGPKRP